MFYFKYAYRELGRRWIRTAVSVGTLAIATGLVLVIYGLAAGLKSADEQVLHPLRAVGSNLMVTRDVSAATAATAGTAPDGASTAVTDSAHSQIQQILDENNQIARTDLSKLGAPNTHFVHDFFMPGNQLTFLENVGSGLSAIHGVRGATGGLILNVEHQEGTVPEIVASFQTGGQVVTIDEVIAPPTAEENQATRACITDLVKNAPRGPGAPGKPGPPLLNPADIANCLPARLRHFQATVVTPIVTITQVLSPPQTDITTTSSTIAGVDVGADQGFLTPKQLTRGRYFGSATANEIVVNETYAAQKKLDIGSHLTFNGIDLTIVGMSQPALGIPKADVYVPLPVLQHIGKLDHRINVVFVRLNVSSELAAVAREITRQYPGMLAISDGQLAQTVNGTLANAASLAESLKSALSLVAITLACAMNAFLAIGAVRARVREFGTLKALGWSRFGVVRQVMMESLAQSLLGVAAGFALGIAAIHLMPLLRMHFDASGQLINATSQVVGIGAVHADKVITTSVVLQFPSDPTGIALAVSAAIVAGLLSGSAAAFLAARLRPMEALREIA